MLPEQEKAACSSCMAFHHAECWQTHGSCAGCGVARVLQATDAQEAAPPPRARPTRGSCAWEGCVWDRDPKLGEAQVYVGWRSVAQSTLCRAHAADALRDSAQWVCLLGLTFLLLSGMLLPAAGPLVALLAAFVSALVTGTGVAQWRRAAALSRPRD